MIVLVSYTAATYKAQIRSAIDRGFKTIYTASCTMGEKQAAETVVRKNYGEAAAETLRQVIDQDELRTYIGDFKADPQRKQVFTYWAFDHTVVTRKSTPTNEPVKPTTKKPAPQQGPANLPTLSSVVDGIKTVQAGLDAADVQHQRNTLADRVWLGCLCLQGKEHHSLPVNARGQGRKKITSTRRSDSAPTALVINPQGFLAWIALAVPGIAQPTAYKYMDAAKGIGLDAWSTEAEVRALVAQRLAEFDQREQRLTLGMLATQGKEAPDIDKSKGPDHDGIKTDAIQTLFAFMDDVVSVKDAFTPVERDTVINRVAEILHRLTGKEWSPVN